MRAADPRGLLALLPLALSACGPAEHCAATGGTWLDCGGTGAVCVDGVVRHDPHPAMCHEVCDCPAEAPVWSEDQGCMTEAACTDPS